MRIGIGYDVHRFEKGRPLILGGIQIPFEKGLAGHSDADVLCHAIVDAILGAAGLGDIGTHFPDSDPNWKNVSSLLFLTHVKKLIEDDYFISNIDSVIIAEQPKIKPYSLQMIEQIAKALSINESLISIKATTTEGLGFEGEKKGVAAQAVVLLEQKDKS
jgi:2-C-methyl-D-erythritol 2,4-cyclodiphosphate synthase